MTDIEKSIRPAATVIVLRPALEGFEVLLLLRAKAIKFAGSCWVFPGGSIDATDQIANDSLATAKVAAARESQEEAGLTLNPDSFKFHSHWTTPEAAIKRFSTWFFIGAADRNCQVTIDNGEIVDSQWLSPSAALQLHLDGALKMMPPNYWSLLELSKFSSIDAVLSHCEERSAPYFAPKLIRDGHGTVALYQEDASFLNKDLTVPGSRHRTYIRNGICDYIKRL